MYYAGFSRAIGDWLLGINATRAYTLKFGGNETLYSVGRVQTPTLALIVERHKEIIEFSRQIVAVFGFDAAVGLQFKEDANGQVKLLEANPRVQGTMVMSALANANVISGAIMQAITGESGLSQEDVNWSARYLRYWGGIGIVDEQTVKI